MKSNKLFVDAKKAFSAAVTATTFVEGAVIDLLNYTNNAFVVELDYTGATAQDAVASLTIFESDEPTGTFTEAHAKYLDNKYYETADAPLSKTAPKGQIGYFGNKRYIKLGIKLDKASATGVNVFATCVLDPMTSPILY